MAAESSAPANKRSRWATKRVKGPEAKSKRESILSRVTHKEKRHSTRPSNGTDADFQKDETPESVTEDEPEETSRRVFFNLSLPADARDEEGTPLAHYARNKIRTAKYTPISFVPKNLYYQFQNIANVYFLFIIILNFFPIFGASNPGLSAVPLIVIIVITAIKDAIEDWRRTVLDNELNNAPVHRLKGYANPNTAEDRVGLWRKVKKGISHSLRNVWGLYKKRKAPKEGKSYADRATGFPRPSTDTRRESVVTAMTRGTSFHSVRSHAHFDEDGIQMQSVPHDQDMTEQELENASQLAEKVKAKSKRQSHGLKRDYGNIINYDKQPEDKARFAKDYWKNVQVGDFVRLYDGEEIPADIVVLSTSDADGACYVETKNLDGETNLKVRNALHCSRNVKHARQCEQAEFMIQSEPAHANLYSYSGVMKWVQHDSHSSDVPQEMAEPIAINNLLLRGSSVRNTDWVLGVVVFTGRETKIMLNSGATPSKRAKISRDLNWNVLYNFVILFIMCLISAIVQGYTWGLANTSIQYFEFGSYGSTPGLSGFITFWAAIILFQNLVPISLYITLEIIRTLQAVFIYSDIEMYYQKLDYPCTPKSWNISDDLGQIEYIFSDKTGTLTQNVMEFKKVTINGSPYGEAYTEAMAGMRKRQGVDVEKEGAQVRQEIAEARILMIERLRKLHNNPYLFDDEVTFVAPDFVADLDGSSGEEQKLANMAFMEALALCHTVIAERTAGDPPKMIFKAQSPDEAALVSTARDCGFTVMGNTDDSIILNCLGEERTYTVLNTLEFNSTRKRMSAIIRMPDGRIVLYCKGADSIVYARLRKGEQAELRQTTAEHLEMFAREGLRTLCIAMKELSEEEYTEWNQQHELAAASITDREDALERVADSIERDFTLLGGTAIEDRLQDGVPDSIALLGKAGIKLWVLTGDKVETAINIGFSCNLLENDMELIVLKLDEDDATQAEAELDRWLGEFGMTGSDEELKAAQHNHEPPDATHALVIDGDSLKLVLDDRLKQKFLLLCKQCRAVLCCRVSPSQKAAVVRMVKNGLDCLTLSIGDGANDVAMIQEAHVGVGIAGVEGRAAVMASDFAIGQFRYLTRLVLVHGRWSYRRLAECIANFFYKNVIWTFAIFWYQIYDNFDCSYVFDYTYILLYNLAFTSLPVILMGVLDQDVSDKVSLAVPQLYRRGIERKEWTQPKFWMYMADGIYQSLIVWFMTYLVFSPGNFNTENGLNINDGKRVGVYVATTAVVVANVYVLFNTYRWDWLMLLITIISILLIWFWTGVYTAGTSGFTFYKAAPQVYGTASFWALLFIVTVICLLPRFVIKSAQKIYFPRDVDIVREQVRQGKFDYLKDKSSIAPPSLPEDDMKDVDSSDESTARRRNTNLYNGTEMAEIDDEEARGLRNPSLADTATSRRHPTGSDGTNYTDHTMLSNLPEPKGDMTHEPYLTSTSQTNPQIYTTEPENLEPSPSKTSSRFRAPRPPFGQASRAPNSYDRHRPRPSFDRARMSMDRMRPSFEQSGEMTFASELMRLESSHSGVNALDVDRPERHSRFLPRFRRSTVGSRMSRISNKSKD